MLIGSIQHSIDANGRYIVPTKYREPLGASFVMAKGVDTCIYIYPLAEWQRVVEKLQAGSALDYNSRRFYRNYLANAFELEVDKQFRVVIPQELRDAAGLDRDIITVGMTSHLEIWDRAKWQAYDSGDDPAAEEGADDKAALLFW